MILSCLPGASQAVQLIVSCLPGASLVPLRLSKWSFPASLVPPCQRQSCAPSGTLKASLCYGQPTVEPTPGFAANRAVRHSNCFSSYTKSGAPPKPGFDRQACATSLPGASPVLPRRCQLFFPASLVPPWCLAGCPTDPFLPPWCLPGASQAVQLALSYLPGASQAVQLILSCLLGASQAVQ